MGDHLFLYAPGGSRRIFAMVEAISDPEHNDSYNPQEEGSCRRRRHVCRNPGPGGNHVRNLPGIF